MVGRRSVPRYAAWLRGQLHDPVAGKASDIVVVTLSVQGCCVEGFWTGTWEVFVSSISKVANLI